MPSPGCCVCTGNRRPLALFLPQFLIVRFADISLTCHTVFLPHFLPHFSPATLFFYPPHSTPATKQNSYSNDNCWRNVVPAAKPGVLRPAAAAGAVHARTAAAAAGMSLTLSPSIALYLCSVVSTQHLETRMLETRVQGSHGYCRCTTSKVLRRRRRRRRKTVGVWLLVWRRCVVVGCAVRRASAVLIALIAAAKRCATASQGVGVGEKGRKRRIHTRYIFFTVHMRDIHGHGKGRYCYSAMREGKGSSV
jgi:hypothetical protein